MSWISGTTKCTYKYSAESCIVTTKEINLEVIHTQFIVKVIQLERLPKKRKKSNMEEEKAKERLLVAKNVQYTFFNFATYLKFFIINSWKNMPFPP